MKLLDLTLVSIFHSKLVFLFLLVFVVVMISVMSKLLTFTTFVSFSLTLIEFVLEILVKFFSGGLQCDRVVEYFMGLSCFLH